MPVYAAEKNLRQEEEKILKQKTQAAEKKLHQEVQTAERKRKQETQAAEKKLRQEAQAAERKRKQDAEKKLRQETEETAKKQTMEENIRSLLSRINTMQSMEGMFTKLLFTHNTPLSVLYKMVTVDEKYIRCCSHGSPMGRGAQFRYGLDSQYGDVIFVMKNDFWHNMKGVDMYGAITDYPVILHIFKNDPPLSYDDNNREKLQQMLIDDAGQYDFRSPTTNLTGDQCCEKEWPTSWCNFRLHLGTNVDLTFVDKVYVPYWVTIHPELLPSTIDSQMFIKLLTNQLPIFSDGKPNPLNGKFNTYGPPDPIAHYYYINLDRMNGRDQLAFTIYGQFKLRSTVQTIQTKREPYMYGNSSTIAISEESFIQMEKLYMIDLVEHGMVKKTNL